MKNRKRPGRRERQDMSDLSKVVSDSAKTEAVTGLIYPEISEELKTFYESNSAYHIDSLPIIYRTAQHQDDIDEAIERLILLTKELYSIGNKEVEVIRSMRDDRIIVTFVGLKDREIKIPKHKETPMSNPTPEPSNQTSTATNNDAVKEEKTTTSEQPKDTPAEESKELTMDQVWSKMVEVCQKNSLPDMNAVDFTDSSFLSQLNSMVITGPAQGRGFFKGEHRMANIVSTITDSSMVNMIPYIHQVGHMVDPDFNTRDYEISRLTYDFGKYGSVTFEAALYNPNRGHPEKFKDYVTVMSIRKNGSIVDFLFKDEEAAKLFCDDHKLFATMINRVHLAHWAFKQTEAAK